MAELPMHYETNYAWRGEESSGLLSIEGRPDLLTGTPHDVSHYFPEHLLVATAEICLANYVLLIARLSKLEVRAYRSRAEGELEREEKAGYHFKRILIRPEILVDSGSEALAQRVVEKAHRSCLVARSLRCPVDIEPQIST